MSDQLNQQSTSQIIETEAKRLAPQMLSRLGEPVDAAVERIAKEQDIPPDDVRVELWDALLGEIYTALSLVP